MEFKTKRKERLPNITIWWRVFQFICFLFRGKKANKLIYLSKDWSIYRNKQIFLWLSLRLPNRFRLKYAAISMIFVNWRTCGCIKNRSTSRSHTNKLNSETIVKFFKKSFGARACAINIRNHRIEVLVKSNEKHYQQCWQHPVTINSPRLTMHTCIVYAFTVTMTTENCIQHKE